METMSDLQQVTEKIKEVIIEKIGVDESLLSPSASLYKNLSIDSLDILEVLAELEKFYRIRIDEEAFENVLTFEDFCNFIFIATSDTD